MTTSSSSWPSGPQPGAGWAGASLWQVIERRAEATPDAVLAHEDTGAELTFGQYRDACLRAAAGLHADHGSARGTGVSWELPTWNESLVLVGALARLGARQNPLIPIYRGREVRIHHRAERRPAAGGAHRLPGLRLRGHGPGDRRRQRTGLSVLVVDRDLPDGDPAGLPEAEAPPATAAEAPVRWLFYTSGTTADPKGAPAHRPHRDGLGAGHGRVPRHPGRRRLGPHLPLHPHRGDRLADGRPVHRVHPADHRGLRPRHHPGVPGRQRRDPGRLGHPVPHGLPGRPAGQGRARPSSPTSAPIPAGGRPSRPSSTTTSSAKIGGVGHRVGLRTDRGPHRGHGHHPRSRREAGRHRGSPDPRRGAHRGRPGRPAGRPRPGGGDPAEGPPGHPGLSRPRPRRRRLRRGRLLPERRPRHRGRPTAT